MTTTANRTDPAAPHAGWASVSGSSSGAPRAIVRLQPDTWNRLAALRRPLVDPDGNLVAIESFDRVVRRLLEERRADTPPPRKTKGARP